MSNNKTLEYFGAWSGVIYLIVFGLGWLVIAQFFPPISPNATAEQVSAIFGERRVWFMLAFVLMMVSTLFLFPCLALIVLITQKIEQKIGMLTVMMGLTAATSLVLNFYMAVTWSVAAFRAERSPELILLFSDYGFLQFMGGIPMFILIWLLIAYSVLVVSPRDNPIVPRWFGYFSLWTAILYIPELLVYFFKVGPFAWDGVIGFWIPALLFTLFFIFSPFIMVPVVRKDF